MRQGARAAVAGTLSIALGSLTTLGAFADDGDVRDLAPPPRAVGSAAPVPHPSPAKRRRRRGRTTFGLTGAATVADRVAPGAGTTADVSNVLGLEARLEHRAEGWGFVGTLPATVALHGGRLGEPDASLVSRRFALFYRNEQLAPFGQLPAGSLPRAYGLLLTLVGGSVSGFAMFSLRRADNDDRGDDGTQPPRRDPPTGPDGDLPIDWPLFDRLRAGWETHELRPAEPGTHSRP